MSKKVLAWCVLGVAAVFAAMQIPSPERTNPPVHEAATFASVAHPSHEVASVIGRACKDCHSNETAWPAYSRLWPASALVTYDVREGRAKLNFSQWHGVTREMTALRMKLVCNEVTAGEMPPAYYRPMHPESRLNVEDIRALCSWPTEEP